MRLEDKENKTLNHTKLFAKHHVPAWVVGGFAASMHQEGQSSLVMPFGGDKRPGQEGLPEWV